MRSKPSLWLTLALLPAIAAPVLGQPRPQGNEFRVNANTANKQRNPVAAFNAAGSALVVWENDRAGLRGRLYGRDGSPASGELALVANQTLPRIPGRGPEVIRKEPAVVALSTGDFLLAWTEERDDVSADLFMETRNVLDRDVYVQKISSAGAPVGSPLRVNATTNGFQSNPRILVRNGADAVVAWQSDDLTASKLGDGIFARLVRTSNVQTTSGELKLSSVPGFASNASLAAAANGSFAVAWEAADADSQGVYVRLFDRSASPRGAEFRVNTTVAGLQRRAAITADPNTGGYLVVWQGQAGTIKDSHIYGQFLGTGGSFVGPQFRVSQGVAQGQISPSIAGVNGHFLVVWADYNDIFPVGVFGVEIDRLGNALGAEVAINSAPINAISRTAVAVSPLGDVLVPWEGFTSNSNSPGISARLVDF
ncbi:MAG TPA: hypothetical protein VGM86_15815 [Thermoanaerobaculia bacterium]|jgi:hypothetical protein